MRRVLIGGLVLGLLMVAGCVGSTPFQAADGADGRDGAGSADGVASCADHQGNLLSNPSFEEWAGTLPAHWSPAGGGFTRATSDAAHCDAAARFVSAGWGGFTQRIVFEPPLEPGARLRLELAVRTEPDDEDYLILDWAYSDENYDRGSSVTLSSQSAWGAWTYAGLFIDVEETTSALWVRLLMAGQRSAEFDDATLVRVSPP
jgi:hypothetical protein